MSQFTFQGRAEIKHINTRKEGPDEEKVLALDIKLTAKIDARLLDYFDSELAGFLFIPDGAGAVRNTAMEPIKFKHEIENCDLSIAGLDFHGVKVSKFSIEPVDGRQAWLTWQNSFQPSSNEVAIISEYLMDEVEVAVASQPDLFEHDNRPQLAAVPETSDDDLYLQAVAMVRQSRRASVSHIQRGLRIGYNRAARLIEQMEVDGYVSPMTSDGARVVLS